MFPAFLLFSSPHIQPGLRSEPLLRGKKSCKNKQHLRCSKYNRRINHRITPEEFKGRLKKFDMKCVTIKSLDMHFSVLSRTLSAASNGNLTTWPFMISQDNTPRGGTLQLWLIEWIYGMDVDPEVFGHSREIGGPGSSSAVGTETCSPDGLWGRTCGPAVSSDVSRRPWLAAPLEAYGALSQRGLFRSHPLFKGSGWGEQPQAGQLLRLILALSSLWVLFLNDYWSCVYA